MGRGEVPLFFEFPFLRSGKILIGRLLPVKLKQQTNSRQLLRENYVGSARCSSTGCEENCEEMSLKYEQPQTVISLLGGKDVFAVLPTRFGKSLIF